jgi:signal transducing adaptor molecule
VVDINTATRVRAMYQFTSAEVGELNFERGDVIKVLDRGFKEWWRGACNGRIGVSFCSTSLRAG